MGKLKLIEKVEESKTLNHGSYYVRKLKNGGSVYHQSFKNNKKTDTMVERLAYRELGFNPEWSLEQARARCRISSHLCHLIS